MARQLEAVYQQEGILRLLKPLNLLNNQKVMVTVAVAPLTTNEDDFLDTDLHRYCENRAKTKDPSITLESVRQELASIPGSMSDDIIAEREERF
ncbi:MAG TPA: hypothetical protein PK031_07150 [Pseudomonadales bacterium]|nr:hypothetical protein [Pseudomonadales bacterium]